MVKNQSDSEKEDMQDIVSLTSEVQRLDAQYNLWGNLIIGLLALTAFVGVCSALASLKQKSVGTVLKGANDQLTRLKDEQREHEKQVSDENIAKANAVAETAKAAAAQANERTQNLEQENIKPHTDLENATAESRQKQTELTLEQQKMAKEQQKTASAQKDAAQTLLSAQFNLQQMRSLLTPRRLISGRNRERFMDVLKGKPVATIEIIWQGDLFIGEPRQFAEDIAEALKEAGWTISKIQGVLIASDPDPLDVKEVAGLKIVVRNVNELPPGAQAIGEALFSNGFVLDYIVNKTYAPDAVTLMVLMIPTNGGYVLGAPRQ